MKLLVHQAFIEHVNHTLCDFLCCVALENPFNWDILISLSMLAYNSAVQESIKESPCVMLFGRQLVLPIDLVVSRSNPTAADFSSSHEYVLQLQDRLHQVHMKARERMKGASDRQAKLYNNRLKYTIYEPGTQVYYYHPIKTQNTSKENFLKWKGPYEVKERLSDVLYRIKNRTGGKELVVHHNKLKEAKTRDDNLFAMLRPRRNRKLPSKYDDFLMF